MLCVALNGVWIIACSQIKEYTFIAHLFLAVVSSPANTNLLEMNGSTFMGDGVNEEAERKERRRSRMLELHRQQLSSPANDAAKWATIRLCVRRNIMIVFLILF